MSKKKKHSKEKAKDMEVQEQDSIPTSARNDLASIETERDDLLTRLQRVSADYLNYQKRVQRDIEQAREFANEQLIKSLLAVLDDMERALHAAKANHDEDDPCRSRQCADRLPGRRFLQVREVGEVLR